MKVGVCQTPEILGDVTRAVHLVRDVAASAHADLLLFPECFLQGYLAIEEHVRDQALEIGSPAFRALLADLGSLRQMLVLGMIERAGDDFYNTAVVIAGGRLIGRYRKCHLTAGESVFTAGADYPVFTCAGTPFGINICYDAQFPAAAAAVAAAGARALLLPAGNMMPREKAYHWQHRHNEIRAQRVRETGLWLASADVTGERDNRIGLGPTCILNPAGQIAAAVPPHTTGVAVAEIDP
ncbi:carbon-nitrogen hydrolase family protein [Actinoplanes sp. NBC_00393]|uniref:carbon-nitrogen hydrolase family protein n=1 Tax=Actinoplanes sp. NBC_00393 TaxID=2975953 RepID=UPI002E1A42FB